MFERTGGRILLAIVMTGAAAGCATDPLGLPHARDGWPDSMTALGERTGVPRGGGGWAQSELRKISWHDRDLFPMDEGLADVRRRARAEWNSPDPPDILVRDRPDITDIPTRDRTVRAAERPAHEPRDVELRLPDVRPERPQRPAREFRGLRSGDGRTLLVPRP